MDTINAYFAIFLEDAKLNSNLDLVVSQAQIDNDFDPNIYTPNINASKLSKEFQEKILSDFSYTYSTSNTSSLIIKIMNTDLMSTHKGALKLAELVVLECSSLYYALGTDTSLLQYTDETHIKNTRSNIKILADWFGNYPKYQSLVFEMRQLDIALGYLQNQLTFVYNFPNFRYM